MLNFKENYTLENEMVKLRPLELNDFENLLHFSINEPELWTYSLIQANSENNLKKYIELAINGRENSKEYDFSNSVLNKVRINKISNIKISAKAPSVYMNEIMRNSNPNIKKSLLTHGIIEVDKLLAGDFDNDFFGFLKSRYESIEPYFQTLKTASNNLNSGVNSNIWN